MDYKLGFYVLLTVIVCYLLFGNWHLPNKTKFYMGNDKEKYKNAAIAILIG
jgi:hypothetical protein